MPSVLIVDDEPAIVRSFARALESEGYAVRRASDGLEALGAIRADAPDVVVTDVNMPGMGGVDLLRELFVEGIELPVIIVTATPEVDSAAAAVEYRAFRYLSKSGDVGKLVEAVEKAVKVRRLARLRSVAHGHAFAEDAAAQRALQASFERAMASLHLVFQPIVVPSAQRVVAYEALVRSGEPSMRDPLRLLDAARTLGTSRDLARKIRAEAGQATLPGDASLFVNVAAADLCDDELYDPNSPLSRIASRVVLEITERAPLDGVPDVRGRIAALRALGYRIALDDLGAGYSGLASFAALEPDVVKIDMGLVRGIDGDRTKQKLIRSILSLCLELRIDVVCEGVETTAERAALEALGAPWLQGYLFARPGGAYPVPRW